MNIGLITYYGDNYGACLQAYALQNAIEKTGNQCEIVRNNVVITPQGRKTSFSARLKRFLKSKDLLGRYKTREYVLSFNKKLNENCENFRNKYLKISDTPYDTIEKFYKNPPEYDAYVCGSDQIWNPTFYDMCNPIYYLDFVPEGKRRIAYAPSVGVNSIAAEYEQNLRVYLSKFDSISVREIQSVELLGNYTDKQIEWVLDPTLLLNGEEYGKLEKNIEIPETPYIFCYLFGKEENIKSVKEEIARILNMPVVSIPFVAREILSDDVKISDAGPADFVNLIKNAAFVVTDSFHATAFSINLQVPFVSLLRQSENEKNEMSSRIKSILKKFKLENRLVRNASEIPDDLFNIDFETSQKKLDEFREASMEYLKNAMERE